MKMIFVNLPVADVARSTAFYTKLGFMQKKEFSNEMAAAMVWDENIWVMLLNHDFYSKFIGERTIADTKTTSAALVAFSMEDVAAVKEFGRIAKENGGNYYSVDMGIPEEQMYSLEVQDPDGNMLEAVWMKTP